MGDVAGVAALDTLTAPTVTVALLITVAVLVGLQATAPLAAAPAEVPIADDAEHQLMLLMQGAVTTALPAVSVTCPAHDCPPVWSTVCGV